MLIEAIEHEELVDQFYSSASGIRAQCYFDIELGEAALRYARDRLRSRVLEILPNRRTGAVPKEIICTSLNSPFAKVWIHQGHWVRNARTDDRQLRIARWEANETLASRHVKDLIRYGSKAPTRPAMIDLIGGWQRKGRSVVGKDPTRRSVDIHHYGFT